MNPLNKHAQIAQPQQPQQPQPQQPQQDSQVVQPGAQHFGAVHEIVPTVVIGIGARANSKPEGVRASVFVQDMNAFDDSSDSEQMYVAQKSTTGALDGSSLYNVPGRQGDTKSATDIGKRIDDNIYVVSKYDTPVHQAKTSIYGHGAHLEMTKKASGRSVVTLPLT